MKNKRTLLCLCIAFLFSSFNSFSQTYDISLKIDIKSDTVISLDGLYDNGKYNSLNITATVGLYTDTSLVRVVATDSKGTRKLMFESYPLISKEGYSDHFTDYSDEIVYMSGKNKVEYLEVFIIAAECYIQNLNAYNIDIKETELEDRITKQRESTEQKKIAIINTKLRANEMLWFAGATEYSRYSFEARSRIWGGPKYNLEGMDYYRTGIFTRYINILDRGISFAEESDTIPYVKTRDFDWRKAHGAHIEGTPYYDRNLDTHEIWNEHSYYTLTENNGWMTRVKEQNPYEFYSEELGRNKCPEGCYVFAPIAAIEAVLNLHFNDHVDYDLSEQHFMDCLHGYDNIIGTCYRGGYYIRSYFSYFNNEYVFVDEESHPWQDTMRGECFENYSSQTRIQGLKTIEIPATENATKHALLKYGPLNSMISRGHTGALIGFKRIMAGDTINTQSGWNNDFYIIPKGHPYIGRNAWIFKQSSGIGLGDMGYITVMGITGYSPCGNKAHAYITDEVRDLKSPGRGPRCRDEDGDGYYFWGVGPKPEGCDCGEHEQQDCDDNDPLRLYYDENWVCTYDCDNIDDSSTDTLRITSNTILYGDFITRPVLIGNGAKVKFTGDFLCTESACIIAEKDCEIELENATFASLCNERWQGFRTKANNNPAYGNTGYSRFISNSSIIEDANYALKADLNTFIYATNTHFLNNYCDVEIEPCNMQLSSAEAITMNTFFFRCTFSTNHKSREILAVENIRLKNAGKIDISDCKFYCNRIPSEDGNSAIARTGIFADSSAFKLNGLCKFENMHYGIRSINSGSEHISIKSSDFINCHHGIYIYGSANADVVGNNIEFPVIKKPVNDSIMPYGIYFDNCSNFKVEGNYIKSSNKKDIETTDPGKLVSGIIINDSNGSPEEVYRNTITGTISAVQAIGRNRDRTNLDDGLQIRCNDLKKNLIDILVKDNLEDPYGALAGIPRIQGNLLDPAGNLFTKRNQFGTIIIGADDDDIAPVIETIPDFKNIINETVNFNYYFNDTASVNYPGDTKKTYMRVFADSVSGEVELIRSREKITSESCPCTGEIVIEDAGEMFSDLLKMSNDMENINNYLEKMTDGGNTGRVLNDIINATSINSAVVYKNLLSHSPYLSEGALYETARKESAFSDDMIMNIMVANPHSAKNNKIMEALSARKKPLPEKMMDEINACRYIFSEKEMIDAELLKLQTAYHKVFSGILKYYMTNDKDLKKEEVDAAVESLFYKAEANINKLGLALYYINEGKYEYADKVLSGIYIEDTNGYEEISNLKNFCAFMQRSSINNIDMYNPPREVVEELHKIDQMGGYAAAYAQGILIVAKARAYKEPVYLPGIMHTRKGNITPKINEKNTVFEIFPNPAGNFINISYFIDGLVDNLQIKIVNLQGINILTEKLNVKEAIIHLNTGNLDPGIYIVYLESNGNILDSKIISIIK